MRVARTVATVPGGGRIPAMALHTALLLCLRSSLAALLLALTLPAQAQTPPPRELQPLDAAAIAAALQRPVGAAVPAARTSGQLALQGKRFYIAEYQLLIEVGGEQRLPARDGALLGRPVWGDSARLVWRSQPDIAALQALVDRGWADLQARLAAAGVRPASIDGLLGSAGAVYEASEPASTAAAPVFVESGSGELRRRYLVLAPSGQRIVPRTAGGLNPGNLAARLAFRAQGIEALSLGLAIHLSGHEPGAERRSGFANPDLPGEERRGALAPLMELVPAPDLALIAAHAQTDKVALAEALVLAPEFGRLRAAPATAGTAEASPLQSLLQLGRKLGVAPAEATRVDGLLELDGPASARSLLYALAAANQAIAEALAAATR